MEDICNFSGTCTNANIIGWHPSSFYTWPIFNYRYRIGYHSNKANHTYFRQLMYTLRFCKKMTITPEIFLLMQRNFEKHQYSELIWTLSKYSKLIYLKALNFNEQHILNGNILYGEWKWTPYHMK